MMINQWIYSRGPRFSAMTSPARVLYHIGLSCSAKHFISSGLGLPDFCRHESWLGNDMDWRGFFNVFFNTVIGLCWSENWVFLPNVWPFYGEKEFIIKFGSTYHISRHTNLEVGPCRAVNWLGQPTFAISNHIKPSISGKKKWINGDDVFDPRMPSLDSLGREKNPFWLEMAAQNHSPVDPLLNLMFLSFHLEFDDFVTLKQWWFKIRFFLHPTNHGLRGASEEKMISVWWFWFSALGV